MPNSSNFKNHEEYLNWYRNYREKNREKLRSYTRIYNKEWREKNGYHNEKNSKMRYPEKEKARRILQNAVKHGIITRKTCEVCGKPDGQGHHDDYSKPLEVKWLCALHHRQVHMSRCV